jgi:hypothetical protein|tara:strand:+ start:449 stop:637 length:189 start_codon:yes stop_codon:yes gene_type:complete
MVNPQILEYNNEKYVLKRTLKESSLIEDYNSEDVKTYYFVDTILKKNGVLYLCNKIEDAQII